MWIPHTDAVVVVQCNPVGKSTAKPAAAVHSPDQRVKPLKGAEEGGRRRSVPVAARSSEETGEMGAPATRPAPPTHTVTPPPLQTCTWPRAPRAEQQCLPHPPTHTITPAPLPLFRPVSVQGPQGRQGGGPRGAVGGSAEGSVAGREPDQQGVYVCVERRESEGVAPTPPSPPHLLHCLKPLHLPLLDRVALVDEFRPSPPPSPRTARLPLSSLDCACPPSPPGLGGAGEWCRGRVLEAVRRKPRRVQRRDPRL